MEVKYQRYFLWFVGSVALACSSGSGNPGPGTGGSGAGPGTGGNGAGTGTGASTGTGAATGTGGASAADCENRCGAAAQACGQPSSQCAQLCATLSEAQLLCLEGANCDPVTAEACLSGGGTGGGGSAGQPGSGGSGGGNLKLGDTCECPAEGDYVTCTDPCVPGLTCVEFGDKFCTEKCSPGGSCSGGLDCTELFIGTVSVGHWCR